LPSPSAFTPSQPEELLGRVRITSPCVADWEKMIGDDKIRHCPECNLSVYNLSGMTAREAAHRILNRQGRLCVRFYRHVDGTTLTQDSSLIRRSSRLAGVALSSAMTVTLAAAQTAPQPGSPPLVQINHLESGIAMQVTDPAGAVIINAKVTLMNQSTQQEWTDVTDSSGNLRLMHLPAGSYSITVTSPGFQRGETVVDIGERQIKKLDVTLRIALMGTVVEVLPLDQVTDQPGGSVLVKPLPPQPKSQSIFSRIWHKLGF
jgi:hypothetical protein